MVNLYRELQPVDRLSIRIPFPLSSYERKMITLLYQPLIGPDAVSLYFMLWAEGEDMEEANLSHYHLMNALDMPIAKIFDSRIALEAIGLLRSWRREEESMRYFIYDVLPPLEAKLFFDDPILSMFLYSKIGEHAYRALRQRFMVKGSTTEGYADVSRTFMDVYQPVQQHMPPNDLQMKLSVEKPKDIPFDAKGFDFDALRQGLSEQLIPTSILTMEVKQLVAKLAFLYRLSPKDMQQILMMSLDETMHVSEKKLKKSASNFYKMVTSKEPPAMEKFVKVEEKKEVASSEKQTTKRDELITWFNESSPIDVLTSVADGNVPFPKDLELAEDLVLHYGMSAPVVNVLLHYVCLRNEGKLNRKYVESIASHWRNTGVKTAEAAMELAKEFEHRSTQPQSKKVVATEAMHEQFKLLKAAAGTFYLLDQLKDPNYTDAQLQTLASELMQQTEPIEFLQILNDGKEPFTTAVRVVEEFQTHYEYTNELMNALAHYAHFTGSLNKGFLEAIAGSWRKENIEDAQAALQFSLNYQQSKGKKYSKTAYNKPQVDESKLPSWYKEGIHKQHQDTEEKEADPSLEEERQKLLARLGYKKG